MAGEAQRRRLIEAAEEYVRVFRGDTGTRRAGLRSQIPEADRALVTGAETLLDALRGGDSTRPEARETPGARARDRASTGPDQIGSASSHARERFGLPGVTRESAGAPAGGGNGGGAQ